MHKARFNHIRTLIIWLVPTIFFAYQFMIRNTPGLLVDELTSQFHINALQFALFSSLFYASYSLMQIPIGILLDKYNPRFVLSAVMALYSIGAIVFASTDNFYIALIARILMGIGSVIGFLGSAKMASLYFPPKQYSFLISLTFTAGFLGAMYGGKPIALLITQYSWQYIYYTFAAFGLLLSIVPLLMLTDKQEKFEDNLPSITFKDLGLYFKKYKTVVFVAICGGLMMGPTEGFADAWGVKYLTTIFHLSKSDASFAVSMVYLGLCIGGPLMVFISEKLNCDIITVLFCGFIMTISLSILLSIDHLSYAQIIACCFVTGLGCGSQVVIFTINSKLVTNEFAAITAAITNSIVMSSGFFIHLIIGFVIDLVNQGSIANNLRIYTKDELKYSLSAIPILMIIGSILIMLAYTRLSNIDRNEQT
ncbi:MFS transporter [Rickettsiales endosymbiont of Stachyamoeba lipophora]|uniref:MFS transporter n=1 Tax=Rickettsiales endosymbiont of Stachyamoeba lipophora TaxID=2486578 RepID=UPI000F650474|nr:MFS transporter [Rickettsiales endosymbiont of Stachyamoeba lipophora]AZL16043.1 MFS transporter [Rickettsiales endosymbiont of Stachyamoeba lipophora]